MIKFNFIKTLTVDRGKEFAGYENLEFTLNVDVYFADTYSSWQRGTNENTNRKLLTNCQAKCCTYLDNSSLFYIPKHYIHIT